MKLVVLLVLGASASVSAQDDIDPGEPPDEVVPVPAEPEGDPENPGASEAEAPPDDVAPSDAEPVEPPVSEAAPETGADVEPVDEPVDEVPPENDFLAGLPRIDVHGFVSQGFLLTTDNDYLADQSTDGSFEFTEVGVNITTEPIENLRLGLQLFTRDLGPIGNYEARFDWFYADYRFADWFGVRIGRVKVPFGLYNEVNDVDVARTAVLLPQSIYPTTSRDFLLAQTGVEVYGLVDMEDAGRLDYRIYGGTVFADFSTSTAGSPYEIVDVRFPYLVGGRLLWETPLEGLRVGGSVQVLRLETNFLTTSYMIQTDPTSMMDFVVPVSTPLTFGVDAVLWVASAEYVGYGLLVSAEYSRWHTSTESSDPMLVPEAERQSERLHVTLGYRFTEWFTTGLYYSLLFPNADDRRGIDARQSDLALTLRFDLNEYWLIKAEAHWMNGTAGLSSRQNDGVPLSMLTRDWLLVLLKTTVYF